MILYPVIPYRRVQKESDELLDTVSVTRYGPQSVASASGQKHLIWKMNLNTKLWDETNNNNNTVSLYNNNTANK